MKYFNIIRRRVLRSRGSAFSLKSPPRRVDKFLILISHVSCKRKIKLSSGMRKVCVLLIYIVYDRSRWRFYHARGRGTLFADGFCIPDVRTRHTTYTCARVSHIRLDEIPEVGASRPKFKIQKRYLSPTRPSCDVLFPSDKLRGRSTVNVETVCDKIQTRIYVLRLFHIARATYRRNSPRSIGVFQRPFQHLPRHIRWWHTNIKLLVGRYKII